MILTKKISVSGMQCSGCEAVIEEAVKQLDGIRSVKADYCRASLSVSFDSCLTSFKRITAVCAAKGYSLALPPGSQRVVAGKAVSLLAFAGIVLLLILTRKTWMLLSLPGINPATTDSMIFVVGLLTGLHCVSMCGSFIVGYAAADVKEQRSVVRSHLLYAVGKTVSYALFGAMFGFLGTLFRITPVISGITISLAGAFLILYGLNILGIFSVLRKIRIKQPEGMINFALKRMEHSRSPFLIGFFSGFLLGCGPLQVMYVLAAAVGSALEGAKILTLFGLGTLPALLGFGLLTRLLSNRMTRTFIHASGIILIVMGSMMLTNGLAKTCSGDVNLPACNCTRY